MKKYSSQRNWRRIMSRTCTALLSLVLGFVPFFAHADSLTPEELYEQVAPSVWLVQASQGGANGSAVVVAPETLITNCHVVGKATQLFIVRGKRRLEAQLRYRDPSRDLCEIGAPGLTAPAATIGDWSRLRIGAKLFAIGSPRGLELTLSDGMLSGIRGLHGDVEALQITMPISPGSSGGGLFDTNGYLIGITTSGAADSQNIGIALPAMWINELRARAGAKEALPTHLAVVTSSIPASAPGKPTLPLDRMNDAGVQRAGNSDPGGVATVFDTFEYDLRDRVTGASRKVVYRIDRREGSLLVINGGSRVEDIDGHVVTLKAAIAGEFEQAMPPGGWLPRTEGQSLRRYETIGDGAPFIMELRAERETEETLYLAGLTLRTVRLTFTGYSQRGLNGTRGNYRATAWYAPQLRRIVRFQARGNGGTGRGVPFVVNEVLELVNATSSATSSN